MKKRCAKHPGRRRRLLFLQRSSVNNLLACASRISPHRLNVAFGLRPSPASLPLTHTPSPGSCLPSFSFPLPSPFLPPFPLHPLPPSRPAPTRKPLPGGHEHLPPSAGILLKAPPVVQHVSGHTLPDSPDPAPPALLRAPNSWAGPCYHPIRSHISGARFFQHLLLAVLPLDLRTGVLGTFPIGSAVKTLYMFKS